MYSISNSFDLGMWQENAKFIILYVHYTVQRSKKNKRNLQKDHKPYEFLIASMHCASNIKNVYVFIAVLYAKLLSKFLQILDLVLTVLRLNIEN